VAELQGLTEEHGVVCYSEARWRPVPGFRAARGKEKIEEEIMRERRGK
jgi:hypothetical protein